jgi:hypothetical protein
MQSPARRCCELLCHDFLQSGTAQLLVAESLYLNIAACAVISSKVQQSALIVSPKSHIATKDSSPA